MTKQQFSAFWARNFSEIPPINYLFKHHLKHRWLRIHSLPDAKRYAQTSEEWAILLERQHQVFSDLLPQNTKICIVSGIYSNTEKVFEKNLFDTLPYFKTLKFKELPIIDMFKLSGEWANKGIKFTPCFAEEIFVPSRFDDILKSIANDEWRLFFIDPKSTVIIAPYDGGVDIIFKTEHQLAFYKNKYQNWLSKRVDGL